MQCCSRLLAPAPLFYFQIVSKEPIDPDGSENINYTMVCGIWMCWLVCGITIRILSVFCLHVALLSQAKKDRFFPIKRPIELKLAHVVYV